MKQELQKNEMKTTLHNNFSVTSSRPLVLEKKHICDEMKAML